MTRLELPAEIQIMMLEMQVERMERDKAAILADPIKHKLTLRFPEGSRLNWRYWEVRKTSGPRVRYCFSIERNLAGYFLGWRETLKRDGSGKRDQWIASKRRATVRERSRKRWQSHNSRVGGKS